MGNTSTKCSYDFLALDVSEADVLAFREHLASAALYAPKDVSMLATQVVSEDMSAWGLPGLPNAWRLRGRVQHKETLESLEFAWGHWMGQRPQGRWILVTADEDGKGAGAAVVDHGKRVADAGSPRVIHLAGEDDWPVVVKPQALGPWVLKWLLTSPEAQGSLDVLRAWETQHSLAQALDGTERAPARGIRL